MRCAKPKPSVSAEEKQVARLAAICEEYGPDPVLKTIDDATMGGWRGIFPDRHVKAATRRGETEWGIFAGLKRDMDERLS
jgi:hypothetical protein